MGSEWGQARLGDLLEITSSKRIFRADYCDDGVPFYRGKEIVELSKGNTISTELFISSEKFEEIKAKFGAPVAGDLLLTSVGTLGAVYLVRNGDRFYFKDGNLTWFRNFSDKLLPSFLHQWFRSPIAKREIDKITIGSTQQALTIVSLKSIVLDVPPIEEQKKITEILSSLDNKIALNRQINITLESMAQALFKSWFVDFDPVIDNALAAGNEIPDELAARAARREALRQQTNKTANETTVATDAASSEQALPDTGLSDQRLPTEIQQLFPDRFVLTEEMGWVPEGWEPAQIKDIAEYGNGRVDAVEIDRDNYVSTENMLLDKAGVVAASSVPEAAQVPSYEKGSILISNIRPYFKKIWLASHSGGRSNDVLEFKVKAAGTEGYLYSLLCQDSFFEYMMATSKGTKMPRGDKQAIMNWAVAVPSVDLRELFSEQVSLFQDSVVSRNEQSVCLADLRDSLLPKLLSGQITIPDAEQQLAEVL